MIPREILKMIRQVEPRTQRGIHALALEASRKALLKVRRISRAMEHRQHGKDILFNREVDAVFAESTKPNLGCACARSNARPTSCANSRPNPARTDSYQTTASSNSCRAAGLNRRGRLISNRIFPGAQP
jgi:hypothetical protein